MAELMLHRTQAKQVMPVYQRFVEQYPDLPTLARATKEELRNALYSLGLQWRIDLIHDLAACLMSNFIGQVPEMKEELMSLPGVSEYIASATRCFAWNHPEPLVDTNTVRVTGRLFGLAIKDSSRRNRIFRDIIAALVDPAEPRAYNYALLDFADQVCTPKCTPDFVICPLHEYCVSHVDVGHSQECLLNRQPDGSETS